MIGKRAPLGSGFAGLQQYLLHGRNGAAPHRSVWTATRNLPDPDPEKAAAVMRATANASARTEKPVYHLSISLDLQIILRTIRIVLFGKERSM